MIESRFHNVEDVYAVATQLRDRLFVHGEKQAAKEIDDTMSCFWTTGSEAIGEIIVSLQKVRPVAEKALNRSDLELLDNVISGATRLWNGG